MRKDRSIVLKCPYCGQEQGSKADLALHQEHEHPLQAKDSYAYFAALNVKYREPSRGGRT
jgi:hypothetical protein